MKPIIEFNEINQYEFPWQAPLSKVGSGCFASRFQTYDREPDDLSLIERQMFEVNPLDHEWRKQFFREVPEYLGRYFAKRYIEIVKKKGNKHANTYLRQKMQPAIKRVRLVIKKYEMLPTTQKIYQIFHKCEYSQDPFHNMFFTEYGVPGDIPRNNISLDLVRTENVGKKAKSRILAELEPDEIKDMAFKIGIVMNSYLQIISSKLASVDEVEREKDKTFCPVVEGYNQLAEYTRQFGIEPPRKYKKQNEQSALQDISRMICEKWWFTRLMQFRKHMHEHLAIAMGQVSSKASAYASWDCISNYQTQKKNNLEYIKQRELFDEDTEETADLVETVLKSQSNPVIRRHELMVRCRGLESIGDELELQGLFLTLTTPSKYHNSYKSGGFINHWNGANPREAQAYLNGLWQCIRAKLGRRKISFFGVRVAEPHHDGTPHWHLLIWVKPGDVMEVRDIFVSYATLEDRGELHPKFETEKQKPFRKCEYVGPMDYRPRCDFGFIESTKGSATGYIAKYISKNIDGFALDSELSDETGKPIRDMAINVSAWKSLWNIRQFQFFGGAPVTTYRELRRFASHNKKAFMEYVSIQERADLLDIYNMLQSHVVGPTKPERLINNKELIDIINANFQRRTEVSGTCIADAMKAADDGNWQGYIMGQGGPFVKRENLPITNSYQVVPFATPHGENVCKLVGFQTSKVVVRTRTKNWVIVKKPKVSDDAEMCTQGCAATVIGAFGSSRSSVNNCTMKNNYLINNRHSNGSNKFLIFPSNPKIKPDSLFVIRTLTPLRQNICGY